MRKIILAAATAFIAVLFAACTKDSSKSLIGSYTYKTSGTVTLQTNLDNLDEDVRAALEKLGFKNSPTTVELYPEQGQMHIQDSKAGDGKVVITFNDLLGNADVADGTVNEDRVTITGTPVKSVHLTDGTLKIGSGNVTFSGSGRKYDDVLIFDLVYEGSFTVSGVRMDILSSNVRCVAQKN